MELQERKGVVKLEAAIRKDLPDLFEEQPDLLHNLVRVYNCRQTIDYIQGLFCMLHSYFL
jgi:hypothetical protein